MPRDGFEVRRQFWGLNLTHGRMPLGDAVERGRVVGPDGEAIGWVGTETTGLGGGGGAPRRRLDPLVTFNGARFDLPLLQTRFLLSRQREYLDDRPHLDLITYARRLWHRPLGGYSLALLEQGVLQVERGLDVPGWLIPSLYVQYLRSGDRTPLEPVFSHNEQDLLSLLALHGTTGEALAQPDTIPIIVDWFGLGRLLEQRGDPDAALRCYETSLTGESEARARWRPALALARHYRRRAERDRLLALWQGELASGVLPAWQALERLAMVWEWQLGDPRRALALAQRALAQLDGTDPRPPKRPLQRRGRPPPRGTRGRSGPAPPRAHKGGCSSGASAFSTGSRGPGPQGYPSLLPERYLCSLPSPDQVL